MTGQDIVYDARALIDQYNEEGVVISSDDNDMKTMETNALRYVNMALRQAFNFAEEYGTYEVDCTGNTLDERYTVYPMPSDFGALDEVVNLTPEQVPIYRFVGVRNMYVDNVFTGELIVSYMKRHTDITALSEDVSLNNPHAQDFVTNFVAARICVTEKPRLVNYFESLAEEARARALTKGPATEESIGDFYG